MIIVKIKYSCASDDCICHKSLLHTKSITVVPGDGEKVLDKILATYWVHIVSIEVIKTDDE